MPKPPVTFEIYNDDETPYGPVRSIRLSSTRPDGHWVFATFREAKQALREILLADEAELRERLLMLGFNRTDLQHLRRRELDT